MKVVINSCFGGFSLSHKGNVALAKKKGKTIYAYDIKGQPTEQPDDNRFASYSTEQVSSSDDIDNANHWYDRDFPRDDPDLIAVVEELGDAANGMCAKLTIAEIPDDVDWEIEEYDGNEWVSEKHRTWG